MMFSVEFDDDGLAEDLAAAAAQAPREVRRVVTKAANNIKQAMRADFDGSRHFRQVGPTVTYDVIDEGDAVEAQIGPNKYFRAARLAHIAYFGGAHGGGGTIRDPRQAMEDERDAFEEHLANIIGWALS